MPDARRGSSATARGVGLFVVLDDRKRLVAGLHELDCSHDDALERVYDRLDRGQHRWRPRARSGQSRSAASA